jgi:hypothetical protein
MAVDGSGNVYFADAYNQRVRIITSFIIQTIADGTGVFGADGGLPAQAQLNTPYGLRSAPTEMSTLQISIISEFGSLEHPILLLPNRYRALV